jgi:hypothetical protein
MRCEFCRDPGHIKKNIEICEQCASRFYAMEEVVEASLARWRFETGMGPQTTLDEQATLQRYNAACAALDKLETEVKP